MRKSARTRAFRAAAIVLAVLAAAALILRFAVFSVKEIRVTGNNRISSEDIIRSSGIRRWDNILTLNENAVKERLRSDYRLLFRSVTREMPGTVVLSVKEREPCCWLTYCGIMYVMDKDRMVLYESENPAEKPADLVEIKGLEVRSNAQVRQIINLGSETQQSIFSELFLEMKVLGCTELIEEADLSNISSLLLTTRDGFTVSMGDGNNIHAKLRAMLITREELISRGYSGGVINVMLPETPVFSPSSV